MANIHDLAQAAGVSIATVSRAFSRDARIKDQTRQQILQLARELNYRPHSAARNLRRSREGRDQLHYCVGLIYKGKSIFKRSAFDQTLAAHLEHHLQDVGFALRLFQCPEDDEQLNAIFDAPIDGVICTFANERTQGLAKQLPCVIVDNYAALGDVYGILPDYRSGIYQAVSYLIQHKHHDIVICSEMIQQQAYSSVSFTELVRDGMQQAFDEAGLQLSKKNFAGSANTVESGYRIGSQLLKQRRPDAIIASDQAMLGIYKALNEHGIKIGSEISLIGIDGLPDSAYLYPALTSIDVNIPDLANTAVKVLNEWICHKNSKSGMELVPVNLIHRESVTIHKS